MHIRLATFIVILLLPAAARSADYTDHDYAKALLEFHRRTLSEPYQSVGQRNAAWDAQAVRFLDAVAVRLTNAGLEHRYRVPGEMRMADLLGLGKGVIDKGCDDPLVLSSQALLLDQEGKDAEARALLPRAVAGLFAGPYPINRAAAAAHQLYTLSQDKASPAAMKAWEQFSDAAQALLVTWEFKGIDRRILVAHLGVMLLKHDLDLHEPFVRKALTLPKADPWLVQTLAGRLEFRAAWKARGGGFASGVDAREARLFQEHLAKAREHFLAAWKLRPDYPEAPAGMIEVELGSAQMRETPRTWFDRAVAAQFDYAPAYRSYLLSLRPQWHGSHDELFRFGQECAATKRFDTRVPYQLIVALETIADDVRFGDDPQYWRKAGVFESVREVMEGYAIHEPKRADWYRSYLAAIAWRSERFAEARQLFEQLGNRLNSEAFDKMRVLPLLAVSHTYAVTGPQAQVIAKAEQQAQAGQMQEAQKLYETAISKLPPNDMGAMFMRGRAKELLWQPTYLAGEWLDIQPDATLAGWYPFKGKWSLDSDGKLAGTYTDGCIILCHAGFFGRDYEMEGSVHFGEEMKDLNAGPIAVWTGTPGNYSIGLRRQTQEVLLYWDRWRMEGKPAGIKPDNTFKIRVKDGRLTAWVNDSLLFRDYAFASGAQGPRYYVGCGGRYMTPGSVIRFSGLRIRRIVADDPTSAQDEPSPR